MEYSLEPIEITQELIYRYTSDEEIFSFYGVPVQKGLFCSKIRNDKRPTVSFYRNKKGKLIYHDFGDNSSYDCFGYVQALFQVSYYSALQIIANDFGIIKRKNLQKNKPKLEYSGVKIEEKSSAVINVEIRDFNERDLNWWGKYGITANTLKKFKVFACKTVWLNGNIFYVDNDVQKAYGYFGGIKDGIELWRIYFPGKAKGKFLSNWKSNLIQGAHMLPKEGNFILCTKSLKDVMCLYEYGIPAIAPCSENMFLTDVQYKKIQTKFNHIGLLWDNDLPGIAAANKIRKIHPDIDVMFLPIKGPDKDFSDFRKAHGHKKTIELIEQAKDYYEEKWRKENRDREYREILSS